MSPHPPRSRRPSRFTSKLSRATWLLALAGLIVLAFGHIAASSQTRDKGVHEASGLARCTTWPGHYWSHADSFNPAELYLLDDNGTIQSSYSIAGIRNVDWEDITSDQQGFLYLGDIGNNNGKRKKLVVYRIPEPDPSIQGYSKKLQVERALYFRYPDQSLPNARPSDFDAESLFWANDHLYLLTKHTKDTKTVLYQFPKLKHSAKRDRSRRSRNSTITLKRISEFDLGGSERIAFGGRATSADVSDDGRYLALLSYHALFIFDLQFDRHNPLANPLRRFDLNMWTSQQCEGVAWSSTKKSIPLPEILIINEGGAVFRIPHPLTVQEPSKLFYQVHDYP